MQPSPLSSSRTFASPHTLGCLFLVFGCVLPGEQAPCLGASAAHLHTRKHGCLTACCETKGGGCGPCFPGQVGCTQEWLLFFPCWHRPAPQGHFLKAKVACNEYDNCGTIMTMRHEREDAGQRGARRPKNSPLWTVCGLSRILPLRGFSFSLYTEVHRGRFLVVPKAAPSLSSTSSFPSPGPGSWVSSSLCMQRGSQYFPRALCSLSILCAGPADHRPLEDRGTGFLSATRSFAHALTHSLVCCMNSCLCQALCWLPVWTPGLVRGQSQARTGWYSAGPAGTEWYSRHPVPGRGWGGSGLRCRRAGASAHLLQALSPYL